MRSGSKKKAQQIHFKNRVLSRFGISINADKSNKIIDQIQIGSAVHLYDQSNRVKIKGVFIDDQWLVVVYDKLRSSLVTVLPKSSEFYTDLLKLKKRNDV